MAIISNICVGELILAKPEMIGLVDLLHRRRVSSAASIWLGAMNRDDTQTTIISGGDPLLACAEYKSVIGTSNDDLLSCNILDNTIHYLGAMTSSTAAQQTIFWTASRAWTR
jgi:hypothetical protein